MSQIETPRDEYDDQIDEQLDDDFDDEDEFAEAASNCHGFFEVGPGRGAFVCGAVGSEDCDECPFNRDLGLTMKQIADREGIDPP